jgi:P27 family predicted phage terminase small subunit
MANAAKPTALRLADGQTQRNKYEPQPEQAELIPPEWLSDDAKQVFVSLGRKLLNLNLLSQLDTDALTCYAISFIRLKEAYEVVQAEGEYLSTKNNRGHAVKTRRPEAITLENQIKIMRALEADFGMNPSSRSKLNVLPKEISEFGDFLQRGN